MAFQYQFLHTTMPIQTKLSKRTFPKGREITLENIKEYPGLEAISDKDAEEAILTIRVLARMMYDNYMNYIQTQNELSTKKATN